MRKFAKADDEAEVNMTPMLDIVFIMLIFFIVTASFVKESGLEINKPEDNPAPPPPPPEDKCERAIAFIVDSNNRILHDFLPVDIGGVSSVLKRKTVECPEANVAIQAAEEAHMGIAMRIYDDALALGVPPTQIVMSKRK